MTLLINCKLWFSFVDIFPIVLAILIVGTKAASMNSSDIRAAWALDNRMKAVGEIVAFTLSFFFLAVVLSRFFGITKIDGIDYGSKSRPVANQICEGR